MVWTAWNNGGAGYGFTVKPDDFDQSWNTVIVELPGVGSVEVNVAKAIVPQEVSPSYRQAHRSLDAGSRSCAVAFTSTPEVPRRAHRCRPLSRHAGRDAIHVTRPCGPFAGHSAPEWTLKTPNDFERPREFDSKSRLVIGCDQGDGRFLSPVRLPVPPPRHRVSATIVSTIYADCGLASALAFLRLSARFVPTGPIT
jgi:hypothetical protein